MPKPDSQIMRLPHRLQAVADLVPACGCLMDIGTDHALLPIALVVEGRCRHALAADIRPGPLKAASRNIQAAKLEDRIRTIQTDGLENIPISKEDVVVLAGLGGFEMIRILGEQPRMCKAIVLQPMKSAAQLRAWLDNHGYAIEKEVLAIEQNRAYVVLSCHYTGQKTTLSDFQTLVGPRLLESKPPEFEFYLRKLNMRLGKQIRGEPDLAVLMQKVDELLKGGQGNA